MSQTSTARRRLPPGTIAERARQWWSIAKLAPLASVPLTTVSVMLNVLLGLSPIWFILGTSLIIGRISQRSSHLVTSNGVWQAALIAFAALVLQGILSPCQAMVGDLIARRVDGQSSRRLMRACMDAPYEMLERPNVLDDISGAHVGLEDRMATPGAAVAGLLALIARYTHLLGAVILVFLVLGPVAGLVIGATACAARFGNRGSLRKWSWLAGMFQPARRKQRYVYGVGSDPAAGKEMRSFALLPWFLTRAQAESDALLASVWKHRRAIYFKPFLALATIALIGTGATMLLLDGAAARHHLSPFALALAVQAVLVPALFGVFFPESDVQTQLGSMSYDCLTGLEKRFAMTAGRERSAQVVVKTGNGSGIRFEGVRFQYPMHDREVLTGIDLEFQEGASTAIVGLNGAGKTTLIKLLTRLYEPTAGRITVGGIDLRGIDQGTWNREVAVVFQDFVRYELDAATNIHLGAPHRTPNAQAIWAAATAAGAREMLAALPAALETPLSSRYTKGIDLSGGQWQRIALARAVYAMQGGASVLVLDEPTAQLDVRSEVAFYERFLDMTRGHTTILISHRFSAVRRADRIFVLSEGQVIESGSHDELLASDGRYAELFRLQAERFLDRAEPDEEEAR